MIALAVLLAAVSASTPVPASPTPTTLSTATVLQRYAAAVKSVKEPAVLSFDYTLDQTGRRTLQQTHRIFRNAANDERDEILSVDGKRLTTPGVRIFRGRRNRYLVRALAPRVDRYDFALIGLHKDGRHVDYVFALTPKTAAAFTVTRVTIDGVRFLPLSVDFATSANQGSGSVTFGRNDVWWVPYFATARAVIGNEVAAEKLSFYTYRFPKTLPPSTFAVASKLPTAPLGADLP